MDAGGGLPAGADSRHSSATLFGATALSIYKAIVRIGEKPKVSIPEIQRRGKGQWHERSECDCIAVKQLPGTS